MTEMVSQKQTENNFDFYITHGDKIDKRTSFTLQIIWKICSAYFYQKSKYIQTVKIQPRIRKILTKLNSRSRFG